MTALPFMPDAMQGQQPVSLLRDQPGAQRGDRAGHAPPPEALAGTSRIRRRRHDRPSPSAWSPACSFKRHDPPQGCHPGSPAPRGSGAHDALPPHDRADQLPVEGGQDHARQSRAPPAGRRRRPRRGRPVPAGHPDHGVPARRQSDRGSCRGGDGAGRVHRRSRRARGRGHRDDDRSQARLHDRVRRRPACSASSRPSTPCARCTRCSSAADRGRRQRPSCLSTQG